MSESVMRRQLIELLTKENAHLTFDSAINQFAEGQYGRRIDGQPHTAWEQLEHLRIAQWDILEFSRNPNHKSPEWPNGYWPQQDAPPDAGAWDRSVDEFRRDLEAFCSLIGDAANDLFAPFPHGDGQTLLREALVLGKHNSYHIGQLVLLQKLLAAR